MSLPSGSASTRTPGRSCSRWAARCIASRCENRPPCRYTRPPGVRQQRDGGLERRCRQCRQRFDGSLVLGAGLLQQPVERTSCGRGIRQPSDRPVRQGRQLGAQCDLQIGEPVVAERLREPQHGRRADLGALGQPGGAGQPGARIIGEQGPTDPRSALLSVGRRHSSARATVSSVTASRGSSAAASPSTGHASRSR